MGRYSSTPAANADSYYFLLAYSQEGLEIQSDTAQ